MKEKTREKIINTFRIIILSLIFSAAIGYSLADWVPPSGTPPFGNTPPPINVGGATQVKSGTLMIDQWLVAGKARVRESTVAGDSGKVLVTKDYVDKEISAKPIGTKVGTKVCARRYATPSFALVTNSHGSAMPVPNFWTWENCKNYARDNSAGAGQWKYRLECTFNNALVPYSQGPWIVTNNPGLVPTNTNIQAGAPTPNCGW